jgi:polar amino acid transport system permease protein
MEPTTAHGTPGAGRAGLAWLGRAARSLRGTIIEVRRTILWFLVVIAIFVVLVVILSFLNVIELDFILKMWSTGYGPLETTLVLTVASFLIGFVGAMPLGLVRASRRGPTVRRKAGAGHRSARGVGRSALRATSYGLATGYIGAIRGTPFLVQLYLLFYAILTVAPRFQILGADVYFWIGLTALTLNTIGYQAEVFRAGFQSIGQGQIDAARSIGLRRGQIFLHVRLPQAVRLILLPLTNEFISLLKASTIVSYIAVYEIFHWSEDMGQTYGHPIEGFLMISMFYLLINIPISRIVSYVEQKKRIPGLGTPQREAKGRRRKPIIMPSDGEVTPAP